MVEFSDHEQLEDWLKGQPHEVAIWIASRAALRVLPVAWKFLATAPEARERNLTALPVLRSALISAVAAKGSTTTIADAANAAFGDASSVAQSAHAADAAANASAFAADAADAHNAAHNAAIATNAAADAAANASAFAADARNAATIWREISEDAGAAERQDILSARPLWQHENPFAPLWHDLKSALRNQPEWDFWVRWYDSMLEGRPMSIDMLSEIALLPDDVWEQGPKAVAERIAEIEMRHATPLVPYPEDIWFDEGAGVIRVRPRSDLPAGTLQDARDRIKDVIAKIRRNANSNVGPALQPEADALEDILQRYSDRPIRLYEVCQTVVFHILQQKRDGVLPDQDILVDDVCRDLQNTADDIVSFDAEVRKTVEARARMRFSRLSPGEKEQIVVVVEAVAEISEPRLADEFREDTRTIQAEDVPTAIADTVRYRLGSRLLKIASGGARGVVALLGALALVEPALGGMQLIWQVVKSLLGF